MLCLPLGRPEWRAQSCHRSHSCHRPALQRRARFLAENSRQEECSGPLDGHDAPFSCSLLTPLPCQTVSAPPGIHRAIPVVQVLGLGIIIPQFTAGQDRYWAPHSGVVPGSKVDLPYKAPLDHILDLERHLGHSKPADDFGPDIPFREHSFLSNPALPPAIRDSKIVVHLCEDKLPHCSDGSAPAVEHEGALWVMVGLTDEQLRTALGPAAQRYTVLHFSAMTGAFSRHVSQEDHARFVRRTRLMGSLWCCVRPPPGTPGHIWYDMWWDTVPHWDQHSREWTEPWSMQLGP